MLADLNQDAVRGIEPIAHATDGSAPNFLMRGVTPGISYSHGATITQTALSAALEFGAFVCAGGYTFDTTVVFQCVAAGGAGASGACIKFLYEY